MKNIFLKIRKTIKRYTDKRFSTIAGTLAYFFLMSIAPFLVWLTLILGKVDIEKYISGALFESVRPIISYLKEQAQSALSGAGIILIATSLYSSTNFFYHLRRSGEIVYGSIKVKGGVKLRIVSAILIIVLILAIGVLAALGVVGRQALLFIMPEFLCDIISLGFVTLIIFFTALFLNFFACPYRLKMSEAITGSILTTVLWLIFFAVFAIYLRFASPGKLYGAIASVIVFLLWCYFMFCCFVIGMIKNTNYLAKKQYKLYF